MNDGTLYRLAAFAEAPGGGNPAGVWIGDTLPDTETMQNIAAEVGYSETAFVAPRQGTNRSVRYFSPEAEVPFCGHATIATGAAIGEAGEDAEYQLNTAVGAVPVTVRLHDSGVEVSLKSVDTKQRRAPDAFLEEALSALRWRKDELDATIPPMVAYAGAWHLVIAVAKADRLADLDYDFEALKALMLREDITTLQLVWREDDTVFHSRNPFPVGGVVEDPATGAAAAALGGYLRDAGLIEVPAKLKIRQGEAMGRPSILNVDIPVTGGIIVSGSVIEI